MSTHFCVSAAECCCLWCRWTTAPLNTSCSALLESVKVPDLTQAILKSLNPNLNCSTAIGSIGQTNQTSVCVAGRVVDPEGNYDDVANLARTSLLGQIVTALATVQPGLICTGEQASAPPSCWCVCQEGFHLCERVGKRVTRAFMF